jgi:Glycosyltransferase family 87
LRRVCRLLICIALVAAAPASAHAATGAEQTAISIASRAPAAQHVRSATPRAFQYAPSQWQVRWFRGSKAVLEVDVDTARRAVLAVWTGDDVDYPMARGYPGWFGGKVSALWVWLPLCLAFIAPFFDPRRPFRLLHLDLFAILGLSVSLAFFNHGNTALSVPLVYPVLGYLLIRSVQVLRRRQEVGKLVPLASPRVLVVGLVALLLLRAALNVLDTGDRTYVGFGTIGSHVVDVGLAGVIGADRIEHGQQLYTRGGGHLDTYGPLNYLVYVPFEAIWPYHGRWDELPAAHALALTFDLATVLLLLALGRRMRPGREGRNLALALAYAWAACPWTAYVLMAGTDDAVVAAAVAAALAAWSWPFVRGAMIGAGTAVKLAPAVLMPAALGGGRRAAALAVLGFAVVVVGVTVPLIPDGGLRELYDTTLGYQLGTPSPFSIWGRWAGFDTLQTVAKVLAIGVILWSALVVTRRPREMTVAAAGLTIALLAAQFVAIHWIYFYFVWLLPPLLAALFGRFVDSPA